jgi:hypothetical protein
MVRRMRFAISAPLAVFVMFSQMEPRATAQVLYGSVVGNITDPSGAVVPGATVSVTNAQTGLARSVSANERGSFLVPDLQAGSYDVVVTSAAFAPFTQRGVEVSSNGVVRLEFQLELAGASERLTVGTSDPLLQTDSSDVRTEMNSKQFQDLPVPGGRNYQAMFKLVPGFTPPRPQNSLVSNAQEDLVAEVNGTTKSTNSTKIDGAGNTHIWLPQHSAYVPPLESVETVNVVTNSMDAEQGQAGGAAVNVIIKSGTNAFHGAGFEYHTNSSLRARNVFYTAPRLPKNIQNQYGGALGGPIVKNKLFFFVDDEETSRRANERRAADPFRPAD